MQLPEPRGPLSDALRADLTSRTELSARTLDIAGRAAAATDPLHDDDLQLSLAIAYELPYRGFVGVADDWEWEPTLLRLRALLERAHLAALRALTARPPPTDEPIDRQLTALIAADDG